MLILKQANKSRPDGHWDANDFDVFEADLSLLKNILGRGIGLPALRRDMLGAELVPGAAAKRDWNLQLSAIKSIHILAIKPSVPVATAPCRQYKLKLEADVSAIQQRRFHLMAGKTIRITAGSDFVPLQQARGRLRRSGPA